jgi:hypothetical protein
VPDLGFGFRDEADEHLDDANEELPGRLDRCGGHGVTALEDVEERSGLLGRPACDPVEAHLLVWAELTSALGGVQDDRRGGAVELVLEVGAAGRHGVVDLPNEIEEVEGAVVGVELEVVQGSWR